jgi:hypothetical protein
MEKYRGETMTTENPDKNSSEESVLDDAINETANKEVEYIENKEGGNLKNKEENEDDDTPKESTPVLDAEEE